MPRYTQYRAGSLAGSSADTSRGPSANIWFDYDPEMHESGSGPSAVCLWDDFIMGDETVVTSGSVLPGLGRYEVFKSPAATITYENGLGGHLKLLDTTDTDTSTIAAIATNYQVTQDGGAFWFEVRMKMSSVATNENSWFIGMLDAVALAEAVPVDADGTMTDNDFFGFHQGEAATTTFDSVYRSGAGTLATENDEIGALAADTFVKLGMKYDPRDYKLSYYVDGVIQATKTTVPDDTGTTFPADEIVRPVIQCKGGPAGSATFMTVDWWKVAQIVT